MTTRTVDFPDGQTSDITPTVGGSTWGGIGGTLSAQTDLQAALDAKAPLASPALTGNPTAPTPSPGDNDTSIATTAFVTAAVAAAPGGVTSVYTRTGAVVAANGDYTATQVTNTPAGGIAATTVQAAINELDNEKANIASPTFTGTPAAPTASAGTNTTQIATTAFVESEISRLGGGINYIADRDGSSIGSWAAYADAAGTSPVDGTGGSPVSTFAVSTDSSIAGTTNFIFTKGAANRQGEGFSVPFSIDAGYQAKPLKITALYKIASGTFVDNDMSVWVYDVTNSTLIACTPQFIKNSTVVEQISCEFQAAYNSTSYRLIFHVGSTSASAYTLRFDSFSVSPTVFIAGASVSDFVQDTGFTYAGLGTVTTNNVWTRRVGDSLEIRGFVTPGTPAASTFSIILPSTYRIDTAKLSSSHQRLGYIERLNSTASTFASVNYGPFPVFYDGSTNDRLFAASTSASSTTYTKTTGDNILSAPGNSASFVVTIPILGWGTSQILSSETDTRVVAATYYVSSTTLSVGSNSQINFDTKISDTHGAVTTGSGWKFTAPIPGKYKISPTSLYSSGTASRLTVYKNGSIVANFGVMGTAGGQVSYASGSIILDLVANDYVDCRVTNATTVAGSASTPYDTFISIERLSGPAQVAASEKVFLQYTNNGGTSITAGVTNLDFTTKVVDSHGAWNGTVFTAPRAGFYQVNGSTLLTASVAMNAHIYKGGVDTISISNASSLSQKAFNGAIYLNSGETISIRADQNCTLSNNAVVHWLSISSQG